VTLDLVRIEPDGSATIAGQGEPGATVRLQMDGAEVASVLVGPSGKFASLFTLAPSAASRLLTVVETLADGTLMAGGPSVAISGVAAPAPAVTAPAAPAAPTVASAATPEPSAPAATADASSTTATTTTAEATTPAPAAAPDATAAAPATTATVATATAATAPAATAPTAVIVDDKGVTVAQTGNVGNVSLGAIAYDAKGGVLLAGKAQPGDVIQIYIDTVLVAAANAGADGSWQSSPEIAPGVHVLRLDELDASGKVVSRFETPMKRETLEALAEANTKSQAAPVQTAQGGTTAPAAPATTAATTTGAATASDAAATTTTPTAPAPPATAAATTDTTATTTADAGAAATSADQTTSGVKTPGLVTITVQPGFTLWRIAKEHLGKGIEYVEIFDDNKTQIKNPDLIYPGQVFLIPTKN
jgi:nucleoid-associated protein YgaU